MCGCCALRPKRGVSGVSSRIQKTPRFQRHPWLVSWPDLELGCYGLDEICLFVSEFIYRSYWPLHEVFAARPGAR
ncbi:hypothetical protein DPMN_112926 [Dreissena polymorpha]|uniref:Uncharacterized protein n=1 Tax=Dreissena polymorpha TaxID=45954 RepID=A0A9D4KGJ7_DREPO|nr:hypothetical protein DPMN_112926 [Dreissena polymorpha]